MSQRPSLAPTDEPVLIVPAARAALSDYERFSAYICQPDRAFRQTAYIGFYAGGRITARVPRVLDRVVGVELSRPAVAAQPGLTPATRRALHGLIERLEHGRADALGRRHQVFILSRPDDPETLRLPREIVNDLKTPAGRTVPFARGQRYVPLARLARGPARTSELLQP